MKNKKLLSGLIVAAIVFLIIGLMLMVAGFTTNGSAEFSGTVYVWGMDMLGNVHVSTKTTVEFNFEMTSSILDKEIVEAEFVSQLNAFLTVDLKELILETSNGGAFPNISVSIVDFEVDGFAVYQKGKFLEHSIVPQFIGHVSNTWIEMIDYNFTNQILEITFGTTLIISSLALAGVSIFNLVSNKTQFNDATVEEAAGVELEEKTE